jgi:hypothetical protein
MFKDARSTYAEDPSNLEAQIIIARELVKLGDIYYEEAIEKKAPQSLSSIHEGLIDAMYEFKAASDALKSKEFEMFVAHIKNGEKQLLEINKTYREWRSWHY